LIRQLVFVAAISYFRCRFHFRRGLLPASRFRAAISAATLRFPPMRRTLPISFARRRAAICC
jgi:hypothetical protein